MPIISTNQPNLINGVSQQADSLKFATQAVEQINGYSSIVDGLIKRNPTRHIKKLISGTITGTPFVHTINRDTTEQYQVVINNGTIRVFDMAGTEKTVTTRNFSNYLTVSDPSDLKAVTIADYTFILNKKKVAAMDSTILTDSATSAASVFILQGAYSVTYSLSVNGTSVSITSGTTAGAASTETIAEQLRAALVANATINASFSITRYGSLIYITHKSGLSVTVSYTDSVGNSYGKVANDTTTSIAGLPFTAYNGQRVKITGGTDGVADDYWVQFYTDSGGTAGVGKWKEIVAPRIKYIIDPYTMPHALVRLSDGTFIFSPLDGYLGYTVALNSYTLPSWGTRKYGTLDSNPDPSFIGKTINDITLFRGRLALAAGENIILSEANKFFNFFKTTLTQLLDSDPIDVAVTSAKVSIIYNMIPFSEKLLLFSDQNQFSLTSADVLTPKTVSIQQTTEFNNYRYTKPIVMGKTVQFPFVRGDYSGVMEYYVSPLTGLFDGLDITAPISKYIKGNITKLTGSANEQVVFAMADGMKNGLYVYKYFYNGEEKIQSAWSKWMFDSLAEIVNVDFIGSTLYLVVKRADGLFLEKVNIESGYKDNYSDFTTRLDRRVTESDCTLSYNSITDTTSVTLPYTYIMADNPSVVTRDTSSSSDTGGLLLKTDYGNHSAVFNGNQQYLESSTSSSNDVGSASWSVAGWVKFTDLKPYVTIFSVGDSAELGGFELLTDASGTALMAGGSPTGKTYVRTTSTSTVTTNTWYFLSMWYDSSAGTLNLSLNNGTAVTSPATSSVSTTEGKYYDSPYSFAGEIDQWGFWKRVLTSTERTYLYGSGTGVSYFDIPSSLRTNMVSWWRFEESFGDRNDEIGNLSLRDFNGVGIAERVVPYAYTSLIVKGDITNQPFYAGLKYDMVYSFSTPLIRQSSGQGKVAVTDGRLQVKNGLLTYANSLYFYVNVTPKYRDTYTYKFTGPRLGTGGAIIGQQELVSGAFRFPVMAKNTDVTVELHNDSPFPCALLSMDWESYYHVRNQRT